MPNTAAFLFALTGAALQTSAPSSVQAQAPRPTLEGAPVYVAVQNGSGPSGAPDVGPALPINVDPEAAHARECYAKVRFGAQYGVAPPSGPQYSWVQEPGPPGSPGPVWCLVPKVSAPQQILISPERYGWIRVLCEAEATPARIVGVQRQLSAAGVYQGPLDGRYDQSTTVAVQRFQAQRHIEDRGYLSYATLSALNVYSRAASYQTGYFRAPNPYVYRPLTTLDTGVLTWPGKR
jgi:hypothetical protein